MKAALAEVAEKKAGAGGSALPSAIVLGALGRCGLSAIVSVSSLLQGLIHVLNDLQATVQFGLPSKSESRQRNGILKKRKLAVLSRNSSRFLFITSSFPLLFVAFRFANLHLSLM